MIEKTKICKRKECRKRFTKPPGMRPAEFEKREFCSSECSRRNNFERWKGAWQQHGRFA